MNKKVILLLLGGMLLLAACSKQQPMGSVTTATTEHETQIETKSEAQISKYEEEREQKIKHVKDIQEAYRKISEENELEFSVLDEVKKDGSFYRIRIKFDDDNRTTYDIDFYVLDTGMVRKSFSTQLFEKHIENDVIQNFVAATVMVLDQSISFDEAKEIANALDESRGPSNISDVIYIGDYGLYLIGGNELSEIDRIYPLNIEAKHKDEINVPVNKDEYERYDYNALKEELKEKMETYPPHKLSEYREESKKVYLTGTVVNKGADDFVDILYLKDDVGIEYTVYYSFNDFLKDFEIGKTYSFYGTCSGGNLEKPWMRADYYEE